MEGRDGRTERATDKRRTEARERGTLVFSQEIVSLTVLALGIVGLRLFAPMILEQIAFLLTEVCRFPMLGEWDVKLVQTYFIRGSLFLAALLAPVCGMAMLGGIVASMAQTGPYFSTQPLAWKLSALSPLAGFRQLFSSQSWVNLGLSILKIAIIGGVIYGMTRHRIEEVSHLTYFTPGAFMQWTFMLVYRVTLAVLLIYIVIAALDWAYKKYKHEVQLMMTKEEVKEEHKQQEANPQVKRAQRKKMREFSLSRMIAAVPKATVVITNPTHVAVALEYDPTKMDAPKVVAKGLRLVAQRIKNIAAENGVPILERPPLARSLYKEVAVGKPIPAKFYEAVAEILAYLHKLGRKIFDLPGPRK